MSDITVYGIPFSPFVRTVRMVLEEKGVGYQLVPSMPHSDEIYAINPFGKVPAFQHDEITMYETVAISTYVEGVFDGPSLVPSDNLARAHMHKWVSIFNDSVAPVMGGGLIVQR
jgi:glutathione S-transferase